MFPHRDNERIALFIDGDNLYASLQIIGWGIDFVKLRELLIADCPVYDCFYYTSWDDDERKKSFEIFLINNGFTVRRRNVQKVHKEGEIVAVKADADILITLDMIVRKKNYDIAVLVSGDGDFCPVIEYLRHSGKRIIAVSSKFHTASIELVNAVDRFIDLKDIRQFVERIPGSGREVRHGSQEKL